MGAGSRRCWPVHFAAVATVMGRVSVPMPRWESGPRPVGTGATGSCSCHGPGAGIGGEQRDGDRTRLQALRRALYAIARGPDSGTWLVSTVPDMQTIAGSRTRTIRTPEKE